MCKISVKKFAQGFFLVPKTKNSKIPLTVGVTTIKRTSQVYFLTVSNSETSQADVNVRGTGVDITPTL